MDKLSIKKFDIKSGKKFNKVAVKGLKISTKGDEKLSFEAVNKIYKSLLKQQYKPENIGIIGLNGMEYKTIKDQSVNTEDLIYNDEQYYAKYARNRVDKFSTYTELQFFIKV